VEGTASRAVVAVASGKGGVGKSTISLNLALALRETGAAVGLLDADVYGPDIPLMVNLRRSVPLRTWNLWRRDGLRLEPVERYGLRIMSVGFLLAEGQAFEMPAAMLDGVLRQLLVDVDWGELDYLIVDLPPGTADVQQRLVRLVDLAGALVVVSPQDVAHLDARKVLDLLRDAGVRVLGGVENMSGFECPHCGSRIDVFPTVPDERSIWSDGVARLGAIPLDPMLARAGDTGRPLLATAPDSGSAGAFRALAGAVTEALGG
jgi:ATP-binding protein involved in chromosome partitioning